jgi:hypothetical protein
MKRAKSPPLPLSLVLPPEYANMSVTEVERRGETIPRLPLTPLQKLFRKTPDPDPVALDAARQRVYEHDFHLRRLELEKARQNASSAPNPNAGPFDYQAHYHTSDKPTRPPGYPPFPITPKDIENAELQVKRIQMGYTQYRDHIEKSNALVDAEASAKKLRHNFDEQEQKFPGAYKYPPYNTDHVYAVPAPPLPPSKMSQYDDRRRGGGKSKRSKRSNRSKRSKTCKNRVHKRRN